MKIIYIIKKGLQIFPPCLSQVLTLNDIGVKLIVYHGKNSEYINSELDRRGIVHFTLQTDQDNKNKFEQGLNYLYVKREINKVVKKNVDKDAFLWLGNCETAISIKHNILKKTRYAINVLELYEEGLFIEKELKKIINGATFVVSCEPHRSEIMRVRYNLKRTPYTIPNKPYDYSYNYQLSQNTLDAIERIRKIKGKKLLYQGVVQKNRPIDQISNALSKMNNKEVIFVVMGKCSDEYKQRLLGIYEKTVFVDYIPAPEHLIITKKCDIGVANYDFSILNTIFCAPNKIFEYSKYGLPILGTDNISLRETIGARKAGVCVDFCSEESIIGGINELIENYDEYSQNALAFYDSVNITELIKRIVSDNSMN